MKCSFSTSFCKALIASRASGPVAVTFNFVPQVAASMLICMILFPLTFISPLLTLISLSNRFESEINVSNGEMNVNGKSIMQISMLAATCGTKLKVTATGPDAREAINALQKLVEKEHFNEPTP